MTDEANSSGDALRDQLYALPKIELHRHLEGSLRLETLSEIASTHNIGLPHDIEALRPHVQIVDSDLGDLRLFLSKFDALRRFYRSPEIIERVRTEVGARMVIDADQVLAVAAEVDLTERVVEIFNAEGPRPTVPEIDVTAPILEPPAEPKEPDAEDP